MENRKKIGKEFRWTKFNAVKRVTIPGRIPGKCRFKNSFLQMERKKDSTT